MSSYSDTLFLIEKEKQSRVALAKAEKAKHDLEQTLLEKTAEANSLINHYVEELETKNELIFHLKQQMELFRSHSENLFETQLRDIKRDHLMSQQVLRKEIEELWSYRTDNQAKNELIQLLQKQIEEMKEEHMDELQVKQRAMEMERKQMENRIEQMHRAFEQFSSEDKLLTLLRGMVSDNQRMAQQLHDALSQIEVLSSGREMDQEILQQCRREVELYMHSNNLNIKVNLALKKTNQHLKKIIHNQLDVVTAAEEMD